MNNTGSKTTWGVKLKQLMPATKNRLLFYLLVGVVVMVSSSCSLLSYISEEQLSHGIKKGPYDAIIVPGNPFDSAQASSIFRARIHWAKKLYDDGIARNIIFSGAAVHSPYKEGLAMKIIADSLGIPSNHTFVETRAEHSTQNVDYGLLLADSLGFKKVAIATDPFQAVYVRHYLKQKDMDIPVLPFEPEGMITLNQPLPPVNCQSAYVHNFIPLREREERAAQTD